MLTEFVLMLSVLFPSIPTSSFFVVLQELFDFNHVSFRIIWKNYDCLNSILNN